MEEHRALRQAYMEGLSWCLAYYFQGCVSWGWFFPYHYGPFLSDLLDLSSYNIQFELGQPLLPFQQLMGCLPPASSPLLPKPYRRLMTNGDSPILQFYPTDFVVDMNGKRNPWEGVNLLPFIDVQLLLQTLYEQIPLPALSVAERKRNNFGEVHVYSYDPTNTTEIVPAPKTKTNIGLSDLTCVKSRVRSVSDTSYQTKPTLCFQPKLVPGTKIPFPGFPSLHVLPIASTELTPVGLNCFGSPSKYPNYILTLHTLPKLPDLNTMASNILGKSLYINWPMMHEAKVVAITNATGEVRSVIDTKGSGNKGGGQTKKNKKKNNNKSKKNVPTLKMTRFTVKQQQEWQDESEAMKGEYWTGNGTPGSGGVFIGEIPYRLLVLPLQGMKTNPSHGGTKKIWGTSEADVPLQLALWQAPAPDPRFIERPPNKNTLEERFPLDSNVLFTQGKYKGCFGEVVGIHNETKTVGVRTNPRVASLEPPFASVVVQAVKQQERYLSSLEASQLLKIPLVLFGKLMGSLVFEGGGKSRYDVGLNLKYPEGLYVVGYTRAKNNETSNKKDKKSSKPLSAWTAGDSLKVVGSQSNSSHKNNTNEEEEKKIVWEYSPRAIRLVHLYRQKFPQLFKFFASQRPQERRYDTSLLLQKSAGNRGDSSSSGSNKMILDEVHKWLSNLETASLPRTPLSTKALPKEAIHAIQRAASVISSKINSSGGEVLVKVPPVALYRCGSTTAVTHTDFSTFIGAGEPALGDRIVNVCANGIPFGSRGTVVGIHSPESGCVEVVMDQEFVGGGNLQGACSNFRGKLCLWKHIMKVSSHSNNDKMKNGSTTNNNTNTNNNEVNEILVAMMKQLNTSSNPAQESPKPNAWEGQKNSAAVVAAPSKNTAPTMIQPRQNNSQQQLDQKVIDENANNDRRKSPLRSISVPTRRGNTHNISPRRSGSAGRPVTWREAVKPKSSDSVGFRGPHRRKGGKPGLERWKMIVKSSSSNNSNSSNSDSNQVNSSNQLRAILGVTDNIDHNNCNNEQQQANEMETLRAADGLKAILGVIPPPPLLPSTTAQTTPLVPPGILYPTPPVSKPVASSNIMPLLPPPNVATSPMQATAISPMHNQQQSMPIMTNMNVHHNPMMSLPPPPHHLMPPLQQQPQVSSTSSAADRLFQMIQQQAPPGLSASPPPPHPSTFNFTYVEEENKGSKPLY